MERTTAKKRSPRPITGEELHAMGDIGPCELVRGRIIWASPCYPEHGIVVSNFTHELRVFADSRGSGKVMSGEVGLYTQRGPDTVRGGDVIFISAERYARWKKEAKSGFLDIAPELVVEVFTSTPGRKKLGEKLEEYFQIGVQRVWVANIARRTVKAYRSPDEYRVFGIHDVLEDDEVLPGFRVEVRKLLEA
jgi:Uma2 family endonuclease